MDFALIPVKHEIEIYGFHSLYYFEFDKNFYHPPEKHDFWELVYVDDGAITAVVNGLGVNLSKGQVIFHQPMEMHTHIANRQNTSNLVVLSFSCSGQLMSFFERKIFSLEKSSGKILSLLLTEAEAALGGLPNSFTDRSPLDFSKAPAGALQLMQCYLIEFLFSLIRADQKNVHSMRHTRAAKRMAESSVAESVEQYMLQNLHSQPSLDVLCRHFSVSSTSLCRIFKEAVGTSPVDHWIGLKIREAKKLIRDGNYNITQISEMLGYSGIHHFTRTFKRVTGLSPTAYGRSVKQ